MMLQEGEDTPVEAAKRPDAVLGKGGQTLAIGLGLFVCGLGLWALLSGRQGRPSAPAPVSMLPVGTVVAFAGPPEAVPEGWLPCDGRELDAIQYAPLHSALGTAHGGAAGKFRLPDYRGRFLRGLDGEAGRDPDRESRQAPAEGGNTGNAVGSVQDDAFGAHNHPMTVFRLKDTDWTRGVKHHRNGTGDRADTLPTDEVGSAETRPKNAYVLWMIFAGFAGAEVQPASSGS